jgi:hypothetical protein
LISPPKAKDLHCNGLHFYFLEVDTNKEGIEEGTGSGSAIFSSYDIFHNWGMGLKNIRTDTFIGGIYMASNIDDSCKVWNSQIQPAGNGEEIIGKHGDVEHLRSYLGPSHLTEANRLYWITDRTPHESMPLKQGTYRQFFRLVTHQVSLWFEDHSTPNPLGVVPNPALTKIVKGNKFGDSLKIVDHN